MKKYLTLLFVLIITAGCKGYITEYVVKKAIKNVSKVKTFQGIVRETGILDKDEIVRTQVFYRKPETFIARVMEPADFKGDTFLFDGENIHMYYASAKLGVIFSGFRSIIPDTPEKATERTKKNLYRGAEENKVSWKGRDEVAGRKTYKFNAVPKIVRKYHFIEDFWGDSEFSFPLKVDMFKGTDPMYSVEYETITFNAEIDDKEFKIRFPRDTTVVKWNLRDRHYQIAEIKEHMNFKLQIAKYLPKNMKLIKIIKAPGLVPTVCMVYYDGLYYFMLTEIKDYGLKAPRQRGVPIGSIDKNARLNFFGESTYISWTKNGVNLTLTGNLPYHEMIVIAENIK
ncbi:outer membrane lipoprotein carrier protein LolA [Elusimicrobiota bacterium]